MMQILEWVETLHKAITDKLISSMGTEAGTLLSGMLLGGAKLDEEVRELFAQNGLAHLLSVSGTHLLLLASLLDAVLRHVPWLHARQRRWLIVALLAGYAVLCGLRPPVVRALIMSCVLLLGRAADERATDGATQNSAHNMRTVHSSANRGMLLFLTCTVMLIFKPGWLFDLGMQLSFGACAGLIWVLPKCRRVFPDCVPELVREGAAVTMAAQFAIVPFLIYYFHYLSLISLVSNIVLVPVLEVAVCIAVIGLLFLLLPLGLCSVLGGWLLVASKFLLTQVLVQASWLRSVPYSTLTIGTLPIWSVVLYYALLVVWSDGKLVQWLSSLERKVCMAMLALMLCVLCIWQRWAPVPLAVYFLDVGQGDCVVVETPQREVFVYDTGGQKNYDTGARILVPFLRSRGYGSVRTLFVSHYDFDHAGGAAGLLRNLAVEEIVLPQEQLTQESAVMHDKIVRMAQFQRSRITLAHTGAVWRAEKCLPSIAYSWGAEFIPQYADSRKAGDGATLAVVRAPQAGENIAGNEASTVLALRSHYGSVLLTGDMGEEGELALPVAEQFTVLKAGHHGSRFSSSAEFLARIRPQLAVISCGRRNRYGHPHADTLERLRVAGCSVVRTDEMGSLKVELGRQLAVYAYRHGSWQKLDYHL